MKLLNKIVFALSSAAILALTSCTPVSGGGGGYAAEANDNLPPAGITVFSENWDVEWDNGKELDKNLFASATNDSKLIFEFSIPENADYSQLKIQDVWSGDTVTVLYQGNLEKAVLDGQPVANAFKPTASSGYFTYQPTASEWTKIKANGIKAMGHGIKITKISLTGSSSNGTSSSSNGTGDGTPVTIWTGTAELNWSLGNDNGAHITADKFTAQTKGVRLTYSSTTGGAIQFMEGKSWSKILPSDISGSASLAPAPNDDKNTYVWENQTDVTFSATFASEDIQNIIAGGLKFYGDGPTITKVELLTN